jgi:amidohydrolase
MNNYKELVQEKVDSIQPDLERLSDSLFKNPEYFFHEYHASKSMADMLASFGFRVETGIAGLETSVKAVYKSGKAGPDIGILGEFDAVPGMGHACGHNLMCAMAVGAGAAIRSVIDETGGTVTVFGTPAEEGGGGKIIMLERGAFSGLDVAMLLHSSSETTVQDISYSRTDVRIHFYGKKAHAATWPEEGINALNPVIELFTIVNAMRLELADRGKILGIIRDGGTEPIMIPDHCSAEFTVRSFNMGYKKKLLKRLLDICGHLAVISGTTFSYEMIDQPYEDIRNNPVLENLLAQNFTSLGETLVPRKKEQGIGCTDMGNVTHEIPGLQSYVKVSPGLRVHTKEFENAVGGPAGYRAIGIGAKAMSMTAVDILTKPELLDDIKKAFAEMKRQTETDDL